MMGAWSFHCGFSSMTYLAQQAQSERDFPEGERQRGSVQPSTSVRDSRMEQT